MLGHSQPEPWLEDLTLLATVYERQATGGVDEGNGGSGGDSDGVVTTDVASSSSSSSSPSSSSSSKTSSPSSSNSSSSSDERGRLLWKSEQLLRQVLEQRRVNGEGGNDSDNDPRCNGDGESSNNTRDGSGESSSGDGSGERSDDARSDSLEGASNNAPPAVPTPAYLHLLYRIASLLEQRASQHRDKGQHLALVEAVEKYAR